MQLGWPLPKRKDLIDRLNNLPLTRLHTVYFQNKRQDLGTHIVPIEFPKYRLDNGRTRSAQAAYLSRHPELSDDFFRRDAESDTAQKAQHEILKTMLGGGEKDLLRFFKNREQMQPFILTDLGYVLNGNRRLCAFRELIEQDKDTYSPIFSNIEVVILPPADDRDLDRLEALYQLTEDIKEPYSWTARAYMLRARQQEHGFDADELSAIYQIPRSEVGALLSMLALAEEYLDDRGKPNDYEIVDEDEFAFRQLVKTREKLNVEADKDAVQQLAFCMIDKWDYGRLYSVIPQLAENLQDIRRALSEEFPTPQVTKENKAASLLGVKEITVDPITTILEDQSTHDTARGIVAEILEAAEERGREQKRTNRVLNRLTKAHDLLSSALSDWKAPSNRTAVGAKLDALEIVVKALRERLGGKTKN